MRRSAMDLFLLSLLFDITTLRGVVDLTKYFIQIVPENRQIESALENL